MGHDLKSGDQRTLRWAVNADLSDAQEVRLLARGGGVTINTTDVTVEDTSETESTVAYTATTEDTAEAARWRVEVRARWADGTVITFPSDGYEVVTVHPDLG